MSENNILRAPEITETNFTVPISPTNLAIGDCLLLCSNNSTEIYGAAIYNKSSSNAGWNYFESGLKLTVSKNSSSLTVTVETSNAKLAFIPGPNH